LAARLRLLLVAGVGCLLVATAVLVSPALADTAPPLDCPTAPPVADRIAATTATYNSIEAKIAAGQSLRLRFTDATAQSDVVDYGVNNLWQNGIDGACVTVAYIVTNPDPNLESTLASYSTAMNLPPANITQMALPAPTDPNAVCQIECSTGEDRLDAEAIHSMAPYANILFVHPPVPETIGMQGWPEVAQAIEMIADQHLADIITVSLGDGEVDFSGDPTNPGADPAAAIHSLDPAFLDAAAHKIPVMFASGDCGPTDPPVLGDTGQCTPPIGVSADHPSDNPWVTSVGGTLPNAGLATLGGRTAPDALWTARNDHSDAEGAGISTIYPKPSWQDGIAALDGVTGRAYPDITADSTNGTSQASPTFAGILALATQQNQADLGTLDPSLTDLGTVNPALAVIGPQGTAAGFVDVPAGFTNTAFGVTGFATDTGYDVASGWGNVWAPDFVPALVSQIESQHGPGQPSRQAQADLSRLRSNISTSAGTVTRGQTVTVTGNGFIPGRTPNGTTVEDGFGVFLPLPGQFGVTGPPFADPNSTVPGQTWDTVTATVGRPDEPGQPVAVSGPDGNGTVTVDVDTSGLQPGRYAVTITGDLLTQTASFLVRPR
jgi:subtilase family protein